MECLHKGCCNSTSILVYDHMGSGSQRNARYCPQEHRAIVNGEVASLSMATIPPVIRRVVQFQETERAGLMRYKIIIVLMCSRLI